MVAYKVSTAIHYELHCSCKRFLSHYEVEVFEGDLVAIARGSLKHFLQLVGAHCLAKLFGNSPQIVDVDAARLVVIEELEDTCDSVLGFFVA